jgi:hypothetical protein
MNRNIITRADASGLAKKPQEVRDSVLLNEGPRLGGADSESPGPQAPKPDNYFDRLLKYVPAELASAYIVLASPVPDTFAEDSREPVYWALLLAGFILAPLFAKTVLKVSRVKQLVMTGFGFVVFVASQGDAFSTFSWWKGYYALVGAVVFLILVAVLQLPQLEETQ